MEIGPKAWFLLEAKPGFFSFNENKRKETLSQETMDAQVFSALRIEELFKRNGNFTSP